LLAVQQLGGQDVPAKQDVFTKGLKTPLKTAQEKGWLRLKKITVQKTDKNNKPKPSKVDALDLTPEGEEILRQAARPDVLAATMAAQAATLRQRLDQDRENLRAEVLAALSDMAKGKSKPDAASKEHAALAKTVEKLAQQLGKTETPPPAGDASAVLEKIEAAFTAMHRRLEQDQEKLRSDLFAAIAEKSKGKGKADAAAKEHAALSRTVGQLAERLEKIEAAMQGSSAQPVLDRIDQAFATLRSQLERAVPSGASSESRPPAPSPAAGTAPSPSLRTVLRQAYDNLCQLIDFQDRLVPLPRLYHQARQALPGLSVEAFHAELQSLWDQRVLELQILNEVRTAAEPDKAIRRGDNLYYFVLWHQP
jgi:hypothetical protein